MSSQEPKGERDEPREGLSSRATTGLIVLAILIIVAGVCVFTAFAG